ncbi:GntR family transcriptional regulator, transcriptional repressor for pyruvate dehydrogenase complex [Sinosporangium album]|uniref:GntR family transcriptional regulator, transcriptional repressor for pyruvate dehydrogenase complex n=1 Tax=Sinosporangium album TaxID=504805 RepID=A0A1G8C9A8_9ACTN|nr:FCD domain-containing protein [Sinosporangium album]SDH41965.1 GntR family transcriptional regulator, transcriptional repressor for pyruvate dehydrogenase complex [Sinosporangium album]
MKASNDSVGRAGRGRPGPVDLGPVRPVTVSRLSELVAEQIREFIVSEDLAENTRLPSERDLATRFGASRPTVSQALRTLSLMGLVEIRPGSGAYVVHRPDRIITASVSLMLDLDKESVSDMAELRLWLETMGVREAVRREPAGDLDEVRTAFKRLKESVGGGTSAWIAADTVFHAAVVRRSGNPFLTSIYESVHMAVIRYEYEPWIQAERVPAWLKPNAASKLIAIHEPIMSALEEADEEAAVAAVLHHHEVMLDHLKRR